MTKEIPLITIPQFLERFEAKRIQEGALFKLRHGGRIRTASPPTLEKAYCPIEFLAGTYNAFSLAGNRVGLSDLDRTRIVTAADNADKVFSANGEWVPLETLLRTQLLKAAGLPLDPIDEKG